MIFLKYYYFIYTVVFDLKIIISPTADSKLMISETRK